MQACRRQLLVRLPKHPTIAGWFWVSYLEGVSWLVFDCLYA